MGSNNELAKILKAHAAIDELYAIGDCNIPRTLKEAFEETAFAPRRV
jgi:hypothetical protein